MCIAGIKSIMFVCVCVWSDYYIFHMLKNKMAKQWYGEDKLI